MEFLLLLAQGTPGLDFGLKEFGILGSIILALLFTVKHLYNQTIKSQEKLIILMEKNAEHEKVRSSQEQKRAVEMSKVMFEVLLYLKFVNKQDTAKYEQHLRELGLGVQEKTSIDG